MRKVMFVLVMLLLAQLAKAETVTLTIAPGSTMSETYFAHHEANLLPYSKEYEKDWLKINNQTDFTKIRPGDYLFECQPKLAEVVATAIEPIVMEGVENEPDQQEVIVTPRQYEPSGLVQSNFEQYTQIDWTPAPQWPEPAPTLESTLSAQASAEIVAQTETLQSVDLIIPAQKPEAFTVSEKEKIVEQNKAAYQRLNKRSYPGESFLMKNLSYLLLGLLGSALIILSIILARWLWPRLPEFIDHFRDRGPSPRETELEAQIEELKQELETYSRHLFIFNYPGLKRRIDCKPLKELLLQVKGRTEKGVPLVFVPGLDKLVPARPLIVEGALRRAQEVLGEKCLYILPEPVARGRKNPEK